MRGEVWVGCAGAGVAALVLGAFAFRVIHRNSGLAEAERMRKIYVGLTLYEASNEGHPAADLASLGAVVPMGAFLTSPLDPYRDDKGPFPPDGGIPSLPQTCAQRISDAYIVPFKVLGTAKMPRWEVARQDPRIGILASEWGGSATPTGGFAAKVDGKVLRINMDGSAVHVSRSSEGALGDPDLLFFKRADPRF